MSGIKRGTFLRRVLQSKFAWAVLLILLFFYTLRPQKEFTREVPGVKVGMTLLGSNLVGWKDQQPAWQVKAETIWRSKDGKSIVFENISEACLYKKTEDHKSEEEFSFSAPWARMEMNTNLLQIGGGIKGRIDKGSFETEEAEVNTESKDLKVPGKIFFVEDELKVEADGMTGNLDQEIFTFTGNIRLQDGDCIARGDTLQYFSADHQYVLKDDIEVEVVL